MDSNTERTVPIVIDAGKVRRKTVKAFKRGEGKLVAEVVDAVDEVRRGLVGSEATDKQIIPVVFVYREKRSKRRNAALRGSCI